MQEYGANIVAGVTPFKGGQEVLGVPVYNSIAEAKRAHKIGASIIFVPPRMAADAVLEAASNEIPWAICITEGIVQREMLSALSRSRTPDPRGRSQYARYYRPGQDQDRYSADHPVHVRPVAVLSRSVPDL